MKAPVLEYTLDHELRLLRYHTEGDQTYLHSLLGKPVLSVVKNVTLHTLLEVLFQKVVRTGRKVEASYRCDTPTMKRYCTMVVHRVGSGSDRGVQVNNYMDQIENRPYQPLLDWKLPAGDRFVSLCSWCKRMRDSSGAWVEIDDAVRDLRLMQEGPIPQITHGMCERCYDYLMGKIRELEH
ncbi:MAG: hypothetical protein SFV32_01505 [Opitutaceae bacterium]|nr:hypothetical protein [Opitutaceae bacterium]